MDKATAELLQQLQKSPTDLAKLVTTLLRENRSTIAVPAEAIERWERDDPRGWHAVREWLAAHGVTVVVTPPSS